MGYLENLVNSPLLEEKAMLYESKPKPPFRVFLTWMVVLGTIAIFFDWSWMIQSWKSNIQSRSRKCDNQEYERNFNELTALRKEVNYLNNTGQLTPRKAAELTIKEGWLLHELPQGSLINNPRRICELAEKIFLDNYPDKSMPENVKQACRENEWYRINQATLEFYRQFNETALNIRGADSPLREQLTKEEWLKFILWVLKWYYTMTISCVILSLSKKWAEGKIKEELVLGWHRWLMAILAGPLGFAWISQTGSAFRRYYKLERRYKLQKHGSVFTCLTPIEIEALWLQAREPMLKFDQAMVEVKAVGFKASRPAFVCAVAWSVSFAPAIVKTVVDVLSPCKTAIVAVMQVKEIKETKTIEGGRSDEQNHAMEVPEKVEVSLTMEHVAFEVLHWAEPKPQWFWQMRARGPPAAVKGQLTAIADISLDCTMQKRGLS